MENEEKTGGVTAQGGGTKAGTKAGKKAGTKAGKKAGTKAGTKAGKKLDSGLTDEEIAKRKTEMPWIEEMLHWKCNLCGHIMTSNTAWNKHSRKNCLEIEPQNPGWYLGWDKKNSRCRYCLQVFVRRRNIRKHIQKRLCPNMPEYNTRHPEVQGLPGNIQNQQKRKQVFVQHKRGKRKAGDFKPSSGLCFGDGRSFVGVPNEGAQMLSGTHAEDLQPGASGLLWNPYPSSSVGGYVGSAVSSSGSCSTGVHIPAGGPAGSLQASGGGHCGESHPSTGYQFVSPYPSTGCDTGNPHPSFYGHIGGLQQRDTQQAFVPGQQGFPGRLQYDTNITGSHTDPLTLPSQGGQFSRLQRPLQMKSHEEVSGGFQESLFSGPVDRPDRQPARDQEWTTGNVHSLQRYGDPHRDGTPSDLPDSTTDGIQTDDPNTLSEQTGRHSWQLWSFKHREESNRLWSDKTLQQKSSTHDPAGSMGSGFLSIFDKQPQHTTSKCGRESPPIEINLLERPWSNKAGLQQLSENDQKSRFGKSQADSLQSLGQDNTSQQAPCGDQQEQFPGQRDSQQRSAMETGLHGCHSSGPANNSYRTRDREVISERSSIHIHKRRSSSPVHQTRGSSSVVGRKRSQSPLRNKGRSSSPHFHRRRSHSPDHQRPSLQYSAKHGRSPQHQAMGAPSPRRHSPQAHRRRCSPGHSRRHSLSPLSERRRGCSPEFSTRLSLQTERDRSPQKLPHKTDRDENVRMPGPLHSDRDRSPRMHPSQTDEDRSTRIDLHSYHRDGSPSMLSHNSNWDGSPRMLYHNDNTDRGVDQSSQRLSHRVDREESPVGLHHHSHRDKSPRIRPGHSEGKRSSRMLSGHSERDRGAKMPSHRSCREGGSEMHSHHSHREGNPEMHSHHSRREGNPEMLSHRSLREKSGKVPPSFSERHRSPRMHPSHRERSPRMRQSHSGRDRSPRLSPEREKSPRVHTSQSERERSAHMHQSQIDRSLQMRPSHSQRDRSPEKLPSHSERGRSPRMRQSPGLRERSPRMLSSHSERERSPRLSHSHRERNHRMHPSHSERDVSPRLFSGHSEREGSPRMFSGYCEREGSPQMFWDHSEREGSPRMFLDHPERGRSPRILHGYDVGEGSPRVPSHVDEYRSSKAHPGRVSHQGKQSDRRSHERHRHQHSSRQYSGSPSGSGISRGRAGRQEERHIHSSAGRQFDTSSHCDQDRSGILDRHRMMDEGSGWEDRSPRGSRRLSPDHGGRCISPRRNSPFDLGRSSPSQLPWREESPRRHGVWTEGHTRRHSPDRSSQRFCRESPDHDGRCVSPRQNSPFDKRRSSPGLSYHREDNLGRHSSWRESHARKRSPDNRNQRCSSPSEQRRRESSPFAQRQRELSPLEHRRRELGSEMSGGRQSRFRTREHRHSHVRNGRSSPEGHRRRSRSPLHEGRYEDSSDRHDSFRYSERESFAVSRSKRSGYRT